MRPSYFLYRTKCRSRCLLGLNLKPITELPKGTGWLEIMGCGMADPAVLKNVNIDADKYSGYVSGMGIERIVMLFINWETSECSSK